METFSRLETTYMRDGRAELAHVQLRQQEQHGAPHFQAVLMDSPLHGTYGGWAESTALALDFLDLAMQAEGADEIHFSPRQLS